MAEKVMTQNIMEYMVWIVEITAQEYYCGNKGAAYRALHNCGIWDLYVEHYDTTHTLGKAVVLEEIKEKLIRKDKVMA